MMPQYAPGLLITRIYTVWLPSVVSNEYHWTSKNESASCLSLCCVQCIQIFIGIAFAVSLCQIYAAGCRGGRATSVLGIAVFPSNAKQILCKTTTSFFLFFFPKCSFKALSWLGFSLKGDLLSWCSTEGGNPSYKTTFRDGNRKMCNGDSHMYMEISNVCHQYNAI